MKRQHIAFAALLVGVAACLFAWRVDAAALLAAYLAAWWFCIGLLLGGLANVWLHNLTGGEWGEAIRAPLLRNARWMWLATLLFLPIAFGVSHLYPWAQVEGAAHLRQALSAPGFKSTWLQPGFFLVRSAVYLLIWCALAGFSMQPSLQRARLFSAFALIVYGFTVSLAAVDWIMSLMPLWYSSAFGLLAGTAQMLAAMALAIVYAIRGGAPPSTLRDLGNLLLMYVMTWAYLAFVQFLIIWAENLPHEIGWYLVRVRDGWLGLAWALALLLFFVPQLVLLSRRAKETPSVLGALALGVLAMSMFYTWWLILPSVSAVSHSWLWLAPLPLVALGALAWLLHRRQAIPVEDDRRHAGERHV
ncbi:MAG TPA: hypothetical protein VN361_08620 [Oxalicibacterium sp.]|nr:hypothetical protein [Oxalicibacterium sp.]